MWVRIAAVVTMGLSASVCHARAPAPPKSEPDLVRTEKLAPGLVYRGSRVDSEADFALLLSQHIRSIVSLQGMRGDVLPEQAEALGHGMRFFNAPMEALPFKPSKTKVNAALDDIGNPANQPVYFHCKLGRDRTGMVAALYRVTYQGWSPADAHAEWQKYGFTNPLAFRGLENYFQDHVDPLNYWKRNPTLVALRDFSPGDSCADFTNARHGQEVFCRVQGIELSAFLLLHAVVPGSPTAASIVLYTPPAGMPPADGQEPAWSYCAQLGGLREVLKGGHGSELAICRFPDDSAIEPAALLSAAQGGSALVKQLSAWRAR